MAISIIFCITWLPLNVLNLLLDLYNPFTLPRDEELMRITYAICHLFGMSSACANPFLYGWFNDNFRGEFKLILTAPSRWCAAFSPARKRPRPSSIQMALNSDVISTMEQGNRSNQIVLSDDGPIIDIVNKDKNSTDDGSEQTNLNGSYILSVKEVRVDIECDRHEITIEKPMSSQCSPLRTIVVPESETTNAILHANSPKTNNGDDEFPSSNIVSILHLSPKLETY